MALNVSSRTPIAAKTYAVAYPLWARLVNRSQAASIASLLGSSEMLSAVGRPTVIGDDRKPRVPAA